MQRGKEVERASIDLAVMVAPGREVLLE